MFKYCPPFWVLVVCLLGGFAISTVALKLGISSLVTLILCAAFGGWMGWKYGGRND